MPKHAQNRDFNAFHTKSETVLKRNNMHFPASIFQREPTDPPLAEYAFG